MIIHVVITHTGLSFRRGRASLRSQRSRVRSLAGLPFVVALSKSQLQIQIHRQSTTNATNLLGHKQINSKRGSRVVSALASCARLSHIFNESLAQGAVPDDWRQANVAPVFKKGEKYDAANYRPVSLTCICCKTLEHIIVSNS